MDEGVEVPIPTLPFKPSIEKIVEVTTPVVVVLKLSPFTIFLIEAVVLPVPPNLTTPEFIIRAPFKVEVELI